MLAEPRLVTVPGTTELECLECGARIPINFFRFVVLGEFPEHTCESSDPMKGK